MSAEKIAVGDPFVWSKSPETWKGEVIAVDGRVVRVRRDYDGVVFSVRADLPRQVWTYESD